MQKQTEKQTIFLRVLIDKQFRALRHILFVLILAVIALNYAIPYENIECCSSLTFICYAISILLTYLLSGYFNFYFLIPKYLSNKKYVSYFSYLSLLILFLLIIQYTLESIAYDTMKISPYPIYNLNNNLIFILDIFGYYFLNFIAFAGCSVTFFLRYWIIDSQRVSQLENEKLQTEVEHIKTQINPSFLFNTLHHIGEIGEKNSAKASAIILKLSKLLRYQLYDCNRNFVFLSSEIQFLNDYLNLEKLHYEKLQFKISNEEGIPHILIPPLLFVPFVRCQIEEIRNQNDYLTLSFTFSADNKYLWFTFTGDIQIDVNNKDFQTIKQRLNLLFGNNYLLESQSPPYIIPKGHQICLKINHEELV